jgi:hypothetical protein
MGMSMSTVKPPNIMIATPTYGDVVTVPYINSAFQLLTTLSAKGIPHTFQFISCSNIVEGRNTLISMFLARKEFSHLLFWDADMGVQAASLISLLQANKPLSGLIYHKKRLDWPAIRKLAQTLPPTADLQSCIYDYNVQYPHQTVDNEVLNIKVSGGLTEVSALGTGYLLITRECAETMIAAFPKLKYGLPKGQKSSPNYGIDHWAVFNCILDEENQRFYSEDYSFCRRWIDGCGGKIYGLVDSSVIHAGQMSLTANYFEKLKAAVT